MGVLVKEEQRRPVTSDPRVKRELLEAWGQEGGYLDRRALDIEESRNYKVTKANVLIQKTRYSLTLQEQKVILYLISKIGIDDREFQTYEFSIKEFCDICDITPDSSYSYLKEVTKKLRDKSFFVRINDHEEILLSWLSTCRYNRKQGTITLRICEDMRPFLLELKKQFTSYHLINVLSFKSKYSIRLYELMKSYSYLGKMSVGVDELKERLDAQNYINFKDFRVKVLEMAVWEINKYSDIYVTYETVARGRKIVELKFTIEPNDSLGVLAHRIDTLYNH